MWQVKDVCWKYILVLDKSYYAQKTATSAITDSITPVKFYHDYFSMKMLFPLSKCNIYSHI